MANDTVCPICTKKVSSYMFKVKCCLCSNMYHKNCTLLNENMFRELSQSQRENWSCRICNESLFPFNNIDDDDIFQRCLLELNLDNTNMAIFQHRNLVLEPFELNEDIDDIPLSDLDPDIHFYNEVHHNYCKNSDYFDECSFNRRMAKHFKDKHTFSLFHLNIRSLAANLSNMLCHIDNLDIHFDVIGITENWLTAENKDLYSIHNYEHINNIRRDRA